MDDNTARTADEELLRAAAGGDEAGRIESERGERGRRLANEHLLGRTRRPGDVPQTLDRMHES